jgi:hypothetical protein
MAAKMLAERRQSNEKGGTLLLAFLVLQPDLGALPGDNEAFTLLAAGASYLRLRTRPLDS